MQENTDLKYFTLKEADYCKIHGRTDEEQLPLPLFWTGSSVEVNVTGSELWIDLEVDFDLYELWAGCALNDSVISRQMLPQGRYKLCLFRGMNPTSVKNVRFFKESQAMSDDDSSHLLIHGFYSDGFFLPVSDGKYRLEFIGDSITSGEGTYGARSEDDWVPAFMSASRNYAVMVSQALNADCRLISQSGWGVLTDWDNNPSHNLPSCYEKICGLLHGEVNEKLGAFKPCSFSGWQPDAIIINLGTNDDNALKQHLNPDGSYPEKHLADFEKAVFDFLSTLRKNNPYSFLVWVYGMLGCDLTLPLTNAINIYRKQTGDTKVSFLQLPEAAGEAFGSRCHPGIASHKQAAEIITEYLKTLLNA